MTTITFSEYLSFDELEEYVEQYNITVVQLQLRGLVEDGTRVTIFTRTDIGFEETENLIIDSARNEDYTIIGITGMYALEDSNKLSDVVTDSKTYLADTSGDSCFSQNQAANSVRQAASASQEGAFPRPLTWDLENLGLLE